MARSAKKCEKEEVAQKALVKKVHIVYIKMISLSQSTFLQSIEKGNPDMARIYATNAIRKRNEALNYLRMSAKFDMVSSQISSAVTTGMVSNTMANVVKGLEKAVQTDNVEKVPQPQWNRLLIIAV